MAVMLALEKAVTCQSGKRFVAHLIGFYLGIAQKVNFYMVIVNFSCFLKEFLLASFLTSFNIFWRSAHY